MSTFSNRTLGAAISHKQTNESILRNILIARTVEYLQIIKKLVAHVHIFL